MNRKPITALLALSAMASLSVRAEEAAASAAPADDEAVKLANVEVNGVPLTQQILPTSRPFGSVFGTNDSILDTPRNVTIISRQQLSDINISSVLDFSKLTSSAYTTTNFGAPSNPSIRGQTADLFINGVRGRITSNGNGLPLDFNSVESVNIVKGPATAVQGTSMYVGGFIDLITKRPYFDDQKGSVSVTIGSYNKKLWTIDVGGPISKKLAYRFSYSGNDSDGFWEDYYIKTHALYGAVTYRPSDTYEIFVSGSANFYRYTENWGLNRVTQNLIDKGLYTTGINVNNQIPDNNEDSVGALAGPPSDAQNSAWVKDGGNVMAWGPEVQISRHSRLLKPGDHSTGREFNFQVIQTKTVNPDFKVVNNSFFSYTARNTLSSYYYSEIIDPSWFAENRTELQFTRKDGWINAGLDLRYQKTKAYDQYYFEPANVWDLTKDHNYINVYNSKYFPTWWGGTAYAVPGWPGRYADAGTRPDAPWTSNGDTNDSYGVTVGPFVQGTYNLTPSISLVGGGRYDHLYAHVREPLYPTHPEASINVWIPSANGSVIYKPTANSSVYGTYNYSQNTSGALGNGGGITGWNTTDGLSLDKNNFTQPSELLELGTKHSLVGNKLFANFAVYHQTRTAKNTSSNSISKFTNKGFEAEFNYQPSKAFYATFSYSYIKSTLPVSSPFSPFQSDGGTPLLPTQGFATGTSDGKPIEYNNSGLPQNQFNALASYGFSNGLTFTGNVVYTSQINNNLAGTLKIPSQYTLDLSAAYRTKKWEYRVAVLNATNEKNWAPPNYVYGNASILALPGTEVQFTVTSKF